MKNKRLVLILRVPRTAGTYLWHSIKGNFGPGELWQKGLYEKQLFREQGDLHGALQKKYVFKETPEVFMGHFPWGVHRLFPTNDYHYVTFLREPITRLISLLYYAMHITYSEEYGELLLDTGFMKKQMPLQYALEECLDKETGEGMDKVLECCLDEEIMCNTMTKQLSGKEPFDNVRATYTRKWLNYYPVNHSNFDKYSDTQMQTMLSYARSHLSHFAFVGFQERADTDIKALCDVFGWEQRKLSTRMNVSKKRSPEITWGAFGGKVYNLLVEMNRYDLKLYEWAREKFYEKQD